MPHPRWFLVFALVGSAGACGERNISQPDLGPVSQAALAATVDACTTPADIVVHDGQELVDALETAPEGGVIAINGMIETWFDANVLTAGITLTCHTPGSGLRAQAGIGVDFLIIARAPGLTVTRLVLDATETVQGAFLAAWDGEGSFGHDATFGHNDVRCGQPAACIALSSPSFATAADARVIGNRLRVSGVAFGIHVQGFDGAAVEENVVEAEEPSGSAIAVNGSHNVHVNANHVVGPWSVDVDFFDGVTLAYVSGNTLHGAGHGLAFEAVDQVLVARNDIRCGPVSCAFVRNGATHVTVEDNAFLSHGSNTGLHFQNGTDGARILRNHIVARHPSGNPGFGGIRMREAREAEIRDNVVEGPWANGIALFRTGDVTVSGNRLHGMSMDGIRLDEVHDSRVIHNRVHARGVAALLTDGCSNTFLGNMLQGASYAAVFEELTGDNVFVGGPAAVVDNGSLDCDGDGIVDANRITSLGGVTSGPSVGRRIAATAGILR